MPLVRNLNPSDPGIVSIARSFNSRHKNLSLFSVLELAWGGDPLARDLISNEEILTNGAESIPAERWRDNEKNAYASYLYAVAFAQRRIKREGDEFVYLKRLIKKNFPKERWNNVQKDLEEIGQYLYEKDEDWEINFYNYMIDRLMHLLIEKRQKFESGESEEEEYIDLGELDTELTSGKNGFIINDLDMTDTVSNLFREAASTRWRINDKNGPKP